MGASTSQHNEPKRGYEKRDISIRGILLFGGILAIATGVVLLLMAWMFPYFAGLEMKADVPPSPLAETRQPPPEPRLQVSPADDLKEMRATENAQLNNYGWVNRQTGIVRIPIDRAIELLAERGLPVRSHETKTQQ
ncbi:MAG: hypothetical protein ACE5K9_10110 [Candidatus Methylomirabilales bacterium]